MDKPTALLAVMGQEGASGSLRLQVGDAVLCSEMGVHFSPDGRFLACTTACRAPLPAQPLPGGLLAGEGELEGLQPSQAEVDAALGAGLAGDGAPPPRRPAWLGGAAAGAPLPPLPPLAGDAAGAPLPHLLHLGGAAAAAEAAAAAAAAAAVAQQLPERVVFEVRVYSMDGPSFGQVVRAKR